MASSPPNVTRLHYRADSPAGYADALLRLIRLARESSDDFSFGPVRLADCERDGLDVSGPDLSAAMAALTLVPGLAVIETAPATPPIDPSGQIDT